MVMRFGSWKYVRRKNSRPTRIQPTDQEKLLVRLSYPSFLFRYLCPKKPEPNMKMREIVVPLCVLRIRGNKTTLGLQASASSCIRFCQVPTEEYHLAPSLSKSHNRGIRCRCPIDREGWRLFRARINRVSTERNCQWGFWYIGWRAVGTALKLVHYDCMFTISYFLVKSMLTCWTSSTGNSKSMLSVS